MSVFSKKKGRPSSGGSGGKKKGGAPLPVSYAGCGGDEEKKHIFQMYGKPLECCQRCGAQHRDVVRWRNLVINGDGGYYRHPYVEDGIWSGREYAVAMSR